MRRIVLFTLLFLAAAGIVTATVSAKTAQQRKAERQLHASSRSASSLVPQQQRGDVGPAPRSPQTQGGPVSSPSSIPKSEVRSPSSFSIPILVYHHVRPTQGYPKTTWSWKMSVSPKIFAAQMQWLDDHGYTPVTLDTFVSIADGVIPGPSKPVVITFDDDNDSQYKEALPVLEQHRFVAVFYLVEKWLGGSGKITAEQAKDMAARGQDIQSHTVTHEWLTKLSGAALDKELTQSKAFLETLTGKPVRHLAYPSTMQNKLVRERTAAAGYATATIMDPRNATEKDDRYRLPRIMMTDETRMEKILP